MKFLNIVRQAFDPPPLFNNVKKCKIGILGHLLLTDLLMFKLLNMKYEALNPWVYFAFWQSFILHLVLVLYNEEMS